MIFRVSFTPEMGSRIEELAARDDLYASTLIREIVEVYVIEQTRRQSRDESRRKTNAEKLREELIGLNQSIMALVGHRDQVQMRLKGVVRDLEDKNGTDD